MSKTSTEGLTVADVSSACWQFDFLRMLPSIRRILHYRFRNLNDEVREEALQEAECNSCVAYARLVSRGRADRACPTSLARYAAVQYWSGRRVGTALNINDVCSAYCQRRKVVRVRPLARFNDVGGWREMLLEDRRASPADLAASRIDFAAFMASLGQRTRRIAELLAIGETTNRVAELLGVTAGRISQIRRQLKAAWESFHEQPVKAAAA
jgi:hypothetical protein